MKKGKNLQKLVKSGKNRLSEEKWNKEANLSQDGKRGQKSAEKTTVKSC